MKINEGRLKKLEEERGGILCAVCSQPLRSLRCDNEWCNQEHFKCKCGDVITLDAAYEYRGAMACGNCISEVAESRERERQEIISEENSKTKFSKGLDFGDSAIGRGNRELFKRNIEIASKESGRLRAYENRGNEHG